MSADRDVILSTVIEILGEQTGFDDWFYSLGDRTREQLIGELESKLDELLGEK